MNQSGPSTTELTSYPLVRQCPYRPAEETSKLKEDGPVTRVRLYDGTVSWLVTGPSEARALLSDDRTTNKTNFENYPVLDERHLHMRATREMAQEEDGGFAGALFGVDPPEHTRQRQILRPSFTVRRVAAYRAEIQQIVDERLNEMLEQGPPADFITAFAGPVPILTVSAFLGIPAEDRQHLQPAIADLFDPERADEAVNELTGYLTKQVEARQASRGAGLLNDLVENHLQRGELPLEELIGITLAILVAGTVTTTSTIALGTLALTDHPDQLAALHDDPGLIPGAVEELLRYLSVVEQLARVATADIELGGVTIKAGDGVLVSFAGANLDPSVTTHPLRLDVTRPPTNHLAFSHGIHHCMGRNLARLELDIAFRGLISRVPTLRAAAPISEIPFYDDATVPRLLAFPVTW